jgi:zinc D-Ala-D-Ala carboxypeptidase
LDNAGLPEKPSQPFVPPNDDIPIAQRETPIVKPTSRSNRNRFVIAGLGGVALLAILWGISQGRSSPPSSTSVAPSTSPAPSASTDPKLLGHYPYTEAPETELQPISADGQIKLRTAAAQAYEEMAAAARADGVRLVPLSGFRSIKEQEDVFLHLKQERIQTATQRANVSAPPGYSEHHTGYAIDIGDGDTPATDLSPTFEQTPAFQWLQENGPKFNFEMSFTKGNAKGVAYEPWHWRFVGDKQSLETFFKARGK